MSKGVRRGLALDISTARLNALAPIAADEGLTIKQLILLLIDEAIEDWEAGGEEADLAEHGRQLASEREDLIARGVDPAELAIPLNPDSEPA